MNPLFTFSLQCCSCEGKWRILHRAENYQGEQILRLENTMCPHCSAVCNQTITGIAIGGFQITTNTSEA